MISIITPSIRPNGLEIIRQALSKQTLKDWEWLICSPFDPKIKEAKWIKDDFKGGYWSLNRCWNKLYKNVQNKLIVHWQDNIWAPQSALEKFYLNYKSGKLIVSGVGDQYESINKWGKPHIKIWSDPRKNLNNGSLYECYFNDIEYNFCAIAQTLIQKYGGADEKLDFLGFGADLYQMSDRMNDGGEHFWLDQSNESYTVRHGREYKDWDKKHILFTGAYRERKKELLSLGQWPYLSIDK